MGCGDGVWWGGPCLRSGEGNSQGAPALGTAPPSRADGHGTAKDSFFSPTSRIDSNCFVDAVPGIGELISFRSTLCLESSGSAGFCWMAGCLD